MNVKEIQIYMINLFLLEKKHGIGLGVSCHIYGPLFHSTYFLIVNSHHKYF